MAETGSPAGWIIETTQLEGARVRKRVAYMDGEVREIVHPLHPRRPLSDAQMIVAARELPPPPKRT